MKDLSIEQWQFIRNSLEGMRKRNAAVIKEHGNTDCGTCVLCCTIQTPTVSILDCFWVFEAIKKSGKLEEMKAKLKQWLSVYAYSGLGVDDGNGKLLRRGCPFLGKKGCTVHGSHPMVCRSYNFIRPGASGCETRLRPGFTSEVAQDMVNYYMENRRKVEELFFDGSTASIVLLPAGVYTLMCGEEEIERQIKSGEINGDNFQLLIRNDANERHTFIKVDSETDSELTKESTE